MRWLAEWRAVRGRRRRADGYLHAMLLPPESADVQWMESLAVRPDVARRELVFARRAIGLIVAERDALDDRTASDVAHQLAVVIASEVRDVPDMGRAWSERWRAYTATLAVRGESEAPAARLARVLLAGVGVTSPNTQELVRATQFVLATRTRANEALRAVFGVASLPDDVRPSALRA